MDDEFKQKLLERLKAIEQRLDTLEADQSQLREAYARSRAHLRRLWLRPFEHDGASVRQNKPGPDQEYAGLPKRDLAVVTADQSRALRT
jgi:hypothetical protein